MATEPKLETDVWRERSRREGERQRKGGKREGEGQDEREI